MAYNMPRVTKSFIIGDLSKMRKGQSNNQIKTCLQSPVSLTLHCTGGWMEEHMLDVNQILVQQQNILNYPVENHLEKIDYVTEDTERNISEEGSMVRT